MKTRHQLLRLPPVRAVGAALFALVAAVVLASCGGDVDSGGTGAPATALAAGPVTGLGSVTVNGVRFDDSSAGIVDQDGTQLAASQLQVGMVAEVDATAVVGSDGQAASTAIAVRTHDEIVGPVGSVNRPGTLITVLGQPVRITVATWFDASLPDGIDAVNIGDTLEVWGQYNARTGEYVATRVAPRANAQTFALRGVLAAVDGSAQTITVGGLIVDIAAIAVADRPTLTLGRFVRVNLLTAPTAGVWTATSLLPGNVTLPDRADARLWGRISAFASITQFVVNGVTVDASAATFSDGGAGVVLGARVAAAGRVSGGVLRATGIVALGDETLSNSTFNLHGAIAGLDATRSTLLLHGIVVRVGTGVSYTGGTAANLANGREVNVLGTLDADRSSIDAQTITFE